MKSKDFQEIGHCGGQFKVEARIKNGVLQYSVGVNHKGVGPASFVGLYATTEGQPVQMIKIGGIGQAFNQAPLPQCLTIFMASDKEGRFGHSCPRCQSYWRSDGPSAISPTICPYCRLVADGSSFLTEAQRYYVGGCCELILNGLTSLENEGDEKNFVIEMDEVADKTDKECDKPNFYYVEESQQKRFMCSNCNSFNDILGRYGYCSNCGKHNGYDDLVKELDEIKSKNDSGSHESYLKDAVGCFDSFARSYAKQFVKLVPMTDKRKKDWEKKMFHNLDNSHKSLKEVFDINIFSNFNSTDVDFIKKMFCRRHIYEHNGGEVDQKYIDESGDKSVRLKQTISETRESVEKMISLTKEMGKNLDNGFHSIFKTLKV